MLPIGDDNSGRRIIPLITYALLAINILVFVLIELPQQNIEAFFNRWGTTPADIMAGRELETLLTSMFLHGGWLHLGSNMLFLWIFGDNVEDAFGHIIYLIFYLACGVAASMAQVLINTGSSVPGVGASGAIAGVLGAYIILFGNRPVRVLVYGGIGSVPAFLMIGLWIVAQLFAGFGGAAEGDNVAYWAHIGGFVAGLLLTFILRGFARPGRGQATSSRTLSRR